MIDIDIDAAARELAGNWRHFDSFCWDRGYNLDDRDDWTIVYTHNRDSGLLDQSNAAAIERELEPFTEGNDPDVVPERHHHWACGWIDGYSIRVYREGRVTEAFRAYIDLVESLEYYPVLDDEDYSRREYETALENIHDAAWPVLRDMDESPPDGWEEEVYRWLWDHMSYTLENCDDRGAHPSEDALREAFEALGYLETESEV